MSHESASSEQSSNLRTVLMIHGGGHMIFSRTDVRPHQTKYLLDRGMLPISLDYRLCPESDLLNGAMSDICDALSWARTELPDIVAASGITVDESKVLVMGWSTGATLAMSTAWTAPARGVAPPNAILAFYGPSDYEAPSMYYLHCVPDSVIHRLTYVSHSLARVSIGRVSPT